jgi:pimeloyl-ACP methyl ester carboxylesterase
LRQAGTPLLVLAAVAEVSGTPRSRCSGAPEGDAEAFLKPSTVHDAFAQDLPEADRWLIVASQRPITLGANTAPTATAAWKTIPSWAVIGTEDRVIPPATQRRMAERAGSIITEVAGSHVSMVSHPAAAIEAILAAVSAVGD